MALELGTGTTTTELMVPMEPALLVTIGAGGGTETLSVAEPVAV